MKVNFAHFLPVILSERWRSKRRVGMRERRMVCSLNGRGKAASIVVVKRQPVRGQAGEDVDDVGFVHALRSLTLRRRAGSRRNGNIQPCYRRPGEVDMPDTCHTQSAGILLFTM